MELPVPQTHKYNISIGILVIFFSILLLIPVNYLIGLLVPNKVNTVFLLKTIALSRVPLEGFFPEQAERMRYLVNIFLFPVLVFSFFRILKIRAINNFLLNNLNYIYQSLSTLTILGILFIAYRGMFASHPFFYIWDLFFYTDPLGGLVVFFILLAFLEIEHRLDINSVCKKFCAGLITALSLFLVLLVSLLSVIGGYNPAAFNAYYNALVHYNAYIYSLVQVLSGKSLLVDFSNQYGFYPYFLEPVFRVFSLNAFNLSVLMGILLGISFTSIYLALRGVVKNKIIGFCGFTGILFFQIISPFISFSTDPYFQYNPHRLIFPAIFVWIAYIFFVPGAKLKRIWYHAIFFISALSIFWNIDSGVVVFFSWSLVLIYQELVSEEHPAWVIILKRSCAHLFFALFYLLVSVLAFFFYTFLKSGKLPDIAQFLFFQNLFYGQGLFMIKMKLIHPWNLLILCYAIGLVIAIGRIGRIYARPCAQENNFGREKFIFFLSVLGAGLFSYYQGRSHDLSLFSIAWPAFILLTVYTEIIYDLIHSLAPRSSLGQASVFRPGQVKRSVMQRLRSPIRFENIYSVCLKENKLLVIIFLFLFFLLSSFLPSIIANSGRLSAKLCEGVSDKQTNTFPALKENMDFIKSNTFRGEKVYILSFNDGLYHMNSHTSNPINVPGRVEFYLRSDYDKIINYFKDAREEKVFVESSQAEPQIISEIAKYYYLAAAAKSTNMYLFRRRKGPNMRNKPMLRKFVFKKNQGSLLHLKLDNYSYYDEDGVFKSLAGGSSEQLALGANFSLELLVKPQESQVDYACILGNQMNLKGFGIQQDGPDRNTYVFGYGTGDSWAPQARFRLNPGEWNYIAINSTGNIIDVYINGSLADTVNAPSVIKNSNQPLYIGSWINGDRLFNGLIDELSISNTALTAGQIQESWKNVIKGDWLQAEGRI